MLPSGLYEQLITNILHQQLSSASAQSVSIEPLDPAEAAARLSAFIAKASEAALASLPGDDDARLSAQLALTTQLASLLAAQANTSPDALIVHQPAELLRSLRDKQNTTEVDFVRPETSVARSSLFTGAAHEPSMATELKKEIRSADRIDLLVSFVKWSGLRLILEELHEFTERGGKLRVITTSYMGATDAKAVTELAKLADAEVRISYDTARTRLHAKTYVFHRNSGFSTAYVGSSNLSNAAISSGLEWNVKLTIQDQPDTFRKIDTTFDSYWHSPEFEPYDASQELRLQRAIKQERTRSEHMGEGGVRWADSNYSFEIRPYPYQQEILDALTAERELRGRYRNLVVAATGTGKTVISAFDYRDFRRKHPNQPNRLLFVAHREEILKQSQQCFRGVLKDANFGELFVGSYKPDGLSHLFVSIQTFNSQALIEKMSPDFYDYIIVDEFHHAAADSYQKLLNYYHPKVLLGLTATPERMDGQSILGWFDGRIAAEIRLPEAIDRKLLAPFQYFGVTDDIDLSQVKWERGGYAKQELTNLYALSGVAAQRRADAILHAIERYVTDMDDVKALGFCVSVEHARFMTDYFNQAGFPAMSVTGETAESDRAQAKQRLVSGVIRVIFTVDVYNEGVDIPEVNTVLFLRPTESLTIFLQQLGRGLRLADGKDCLTVLDFIGQQNQHYDFESKLTALLSETRCGIKREIEDGFISVPKGCYIHLEKQAQRYILDNIKRALSTKPGLMDRIRTFEADTCLPLTISNFCGHYGIAPRSLYRYGTTFARLCVLAQALPDFTEPAEELLGKAMLRVCGIDSARWLAFITDALQQADNLHDHDLSSEQLRMTAMLQFTLWQKSYAECGFTEATDAYRFLAQSPLLCSELLSLLSWNLDHIDVPSVPLGGACPLDVHCTYTRDQALVALDFMKPSTVREGVKWLPEQKTDVFFVTLNKADKDYSPTTMYNDYSVSDTLFHWQSQSTTSADSTTGQRYIHHAEMGTRILLFVREYKQEKGYGASPYTFFGEASYVSHTGERPMNILLKLKEAIPAKELRKTNQLVM